MAAITRKHYGAIPMSRSEFSNMDVEAYRFTPSIAHAVPRSPLNPARVTRCCSSQAIGETIRDYMDECGFVRIVVPVLCCAIIAFIVVVIVKNPEITNYGYNGGYL